MHSLVENYGDCGMDEEIEAVKREWWNVVTENSWEYLAGGEERGVVRSMQIGHSFNNIRCLRKCLYRWEYSFLNVDKRRIFCDVSNWVT